MENIGSVYGSEDTTVLYMSFKSPLYLLPAPGQDGVSAPNRPELLSAGRVVYSRYS